MELQFLLDAAMIKKSRARPSAVDKTPQIVLYGPFLTACNGGTVMFIDTDVHLVRDQQNPSQT